MAQQSATTWYWAHKHI